MTERRVDLIFEGELEPGFDQDWVRQSLESLFGFDTEGETQLFSGQPIVLGENMDVTTAKTFQRALSGAGAVTRLEAINDAASAGQTERRHSADRRVLANRRSRDRAASIVPDRRQTRDRRR